jgi:hypothetical protein
MTEKKKKIENAAERTGAVVGGGIKKSAEVVNDFGKGLKKKLQEKK